MKRTKKADQRIERLSDPLFKPLPIEGMSLVTGGATGSASVTYSGGWDGSGDIDFGRDDEE